MAIDYVARTISIVLSSQPSWLLVARFGPSAELGALTTAIEAEALSFGPSEREQLCTYLCTRDMTMGPVSQDVYAIGGLRIDLQDVQESSKLLAEPAGARDTMKTLRVQSVDQWRDWLDAHHASESEVWLIFYKQHTGVASIAYKDALDEALCFGWVDSLIKRLDGRRFARKFTPRRADSRWSDVNRKRYAILKAGGRLRPAGIERAPIGRGYGSRPPRLSMPSRLPPYMQAALRAHSRARRCFEALAPAQRRRYFAWIESAKREETKLRRLKEAIRLLASGKVLGLK